ncbi:hypothetical protein Ddye_003491 [Dipteronia dyeriana]|uniref:Protein FAR1-RELATED SEQUENCE n=1 Tax=Dipteronia dyeriana TaxID=168575 RepID=A0AAE0CVD1_9ROSI|nr:hypothetical protein Ddye_003491 [Dipteronia dyeriana]
MAGNGSQSKLDNKDGLFLTKKKKVFYWVNSVQISSWDGSDNQDVDLSHVKSMKFDSVDDARSFYLGYAKAYRFGIRATNLDFDCEGRVLRRKWVCDKQGSIKEEYMTNKNRKHKIRLQTRLNCKACFSIGLDSHTLKYNAFIEQNFYCRFNTDDDRLANIFWRDSHSLFEYKCFEDVLVFDTTYKTNIYGKPLVLFVSANNRSATCVFCAKLLLDETFMSYNWALTKLMDSTSDKHPFSIMMNKDEAMRQAIDEAFPNY